MDSRQAQALLNNLNKLKLSNRVRATFTSYLMGIIESDPSNAPSAIIERLPASQRVNINDTVQSIQTFNQELLSRARTQLATIPDSVFDNPANESSEGNSDQ